MRRTASSAAALTRPRARARLIALRMLAQRRLTEAQLWARLERRGYEPSEIAEAVESVRRDGFLDDELFARLFIDGRSKAVGDARLVAELVKRGIERDAAKRSVVTAERPEPERLRLAIEKLFRTRTTLSYPSAARALERLGFPAHAIYRELREHVARGAAFAGDADDASGAEDSP